jgi:membrane protein insertase Oxa1/YidC/SpoIIIJ
VINFGAFKLPLLGWSDIRALPIIYLASQLLYGKFTQTPQSGQNASQMKLMMFGMPIMFFFVLYDVPSGLLLYWIVSNVLTILQQIVINDMLKKHKLKVASGGPQAALSGASSGGSSNGSGMRSAGRTSVKSSGAKAASPQNQEGLGDKVKGWLEKKAAEAASSSKGKTDGKR